MTVVWDFNLDDALKAQKLCRPVPGDNVHIQLRVTGDDYMWTEANAAKYGPAYFDAIYRYN